MIPQEKQTPKKIQELPFLPKLKATLRILLFFRQKVFIDTYWNNKKDIATFIEEKNPIVLGLKFGNDKLLQFDFRMQGTEAQKKTRKVVLVYARDTWWMTLIGILLHMFFAWTGFVCRDNWCMRMFGFRDNKIARASIGI